LQQDIVNRKAVLQTAMSSSYCHLILCTLVHNGEKWERSFDLLNGRAAIRLGLPHILVSNLRVPRPEKATATGAQMVALHLCISTPSANKPCNTRGRQSFQTLYIIKVICFCIIRKPLRAFKKSAAAVIADRTACSSTIRADHMQQYDRLKNHYCVISVLTLFILFATSRTVNKNVSTGAVKRAKPVTEPGVRKLPANYYQTSFDYKLMACPHWRVAEFGDCCQNGDCRRIRRDYSRQYGQAIRRTNS